jgi:2-polyprenyl-3-methyl-5-hydroxy-6-metoxy-1,4-benzoquinol methylase
MLTKDESLKQWHQDEEIWWDKYGEYMTYQWKLTPELESILKTELNNDYFDFLLNPGERLLDLGCGSGWLSLHFAERGMEVLGIDLSQQQINAANTLKTDSHLPNVEFECRDLAHWDCEKYKGQFSSVFVSAFLHHLAEVELEMIIGKIATVLKPGGRAYMYEPLKSSTTRSIMVRSIDLFNGVLMRLLMTVIPKVFDQFSTRHKLEVKNGYTMCSPREGPIDVELIEMLCADEFQIVEVKGWHLNSVGFAMQSMGLKDTLRKMYASAVRFLYWEEKLLFRTFGWQSFSRPARFILCGIKLVRK